MIRLAQDKDTGRLIELGVEFAYRTSKHHTMSVNPAKIKELTIAAVGDPGSVVIVLENENQLDGFIYGILVRPYFSDDLVLQELAFYTTGPKGGFQLIDAFEKRGKELGVNKIVLGYKPAYYNLSKIYERKGFRLLEEQYIKGVA